MCCEEKAMSFKILCTLIIIVYATTVAIKSSYGNIQFTAPLVTLKKCSSTTKKEFFNLSNYKIEKLKNLASLNEENPETGLIFVMEFLTKTS